ncbi:MAG: hypothetical protein ACHQAY_01000 [Hyphomicrobiales bacterium]
MLKLVLGGLWICAVTLLSSYATTYWKVGHSDVVARDDTPAGLEYKKIKPINVPMIADGAVQGYIVVQFVLTTSAAASKKLSVPPEVFLQDEAFRAIYSDATLDFRHLEKYDITKLTKTLVQRVNERLDTDVVKDILVQEFNYVSKDDMKR